MSSPGPFEIAQAIGNRLGQAESNVQERQAIDQILQQAQEGGDPLQKGQLLSQLISRVSPDKQKNIFAMLESQQKQKQHKGLGDTLERLGIDRGLASSPELAKEFLKRQFDQDLLNQMDFGFGSNQGNRPTVQNNVQDSGTPQLNENTEIEENENLPVNELINLSDQHLLNRSGHPSKLISEPAKEALKQKQENRKNEEQRRLNRIKFGQDIAKEELKEINKVGRELAQKESSLNLMIDALENRDLSFWTPDNLAEVTGIEAFRTMEGAVFKTAAKEFFLSSLQRAGARPNQWVEQQIQDMLTKIGRSKAANLGVARALRNEIDIDKERIRLSEEIADDIDAGDGDYRKFPTRMSRELSKYANNKQKELFNDLRALKSIDTNTPQKFQKVPQGTPVSEYMVDALLVTFNNDWAKAEKEAKKLGYVIE